MNCKCSFFSTKRMSFSLRNVLTLKKIFGFHSFKYCKLVELIVAKKKNFMAHSNSNESNKKPILLLSDVLFYKSRFQKNFAVQIDKTKIKLLAISHESQKKNLFTRRTVKNFMEITYIKSIRNIFELHFHR